MLETWTNRGNARTREGWDMMSAYHVQKDVDLLKGHWNVCFDRRHIVSSCLKVAY